MINEMSSGSCKKQTVDTRSNWMMFMFVSKCRYNVFRKRSTIQVCEAGFKELERFGFEFGAFGFAGTHVHFAVNVPEKYSLVNAKIMLKTWSAKGSSEISQTSGNVTRAAASGADTSTTKASVLTKQRQ